MPGIIDGVVGSYLGPGFVAVLYLPEWTVLMHVGYDEKCTVLFDIFLG
jgi:hypothetical protein